MKYAKNILVSLLALSVLFCCLGASVSFAADSGVKAGDVIPFGHYAQAKEASDSGEAIEWLVLDVQGNEALLISKYVLESRAFNEADNSGSIWEKSSLRKWLNEDFLNAAFTEEEQKAILTSTVDNGEEQTSEFWSMFSAPIVGDNTEDKVYILSYAEALKYFNSDSDRSSEVAPRLYHNNGWWLRSPGMLASNLMYVHDDGAVNDNETMWETGTVGVRPVIKVDLDLLK
ncbi:MAG: DUF6273 domain-containing protein [Oscillospiraceae bacterium]|nr:DUF6273 domain-containing protein [Oscillospiraceae bacterium]